MLSNLKSSRNLYLYASIIFSIYVLILDYFLNLEISLGLSYALIMIFTLFQEGKKPVFNTTIYLTILVLIGSIFSIGDLSPMLIVFNRIVDTAIIWFAAFLIIKFKNLEAEKDEKERQFEETLNSAPTPIYITRKSDSKILYANKASIQFNGYDQSEIVKKHGTDLYVNPSDREVILKKLQEDGSITNYEMQIRNREGKILDILSSIKSIRFKNEDAVISVNADITYQKQVEKKFKQLLEFTPDSIFIINKEGDIVITNARAKQLFKFNPQEDPGVNIDYILPGQKENLTSIDSNNNSAKEFETEAVRNDGSTFPAVVTSSFLETEEGMLNAVAIRDNTERNERESEIIRSRNYYLTILEEFPAMIWRSGLDGNFDYFNQTWLNYTGRTFEEEKGEGWTENVHPEDIQKVLNIYQPNFENKIPFVIEFRLKKHDGSYGWVINYGRPMYDINGTFTGFIGNCYDITENKIAETRLKESEKKFHAIFNQTFQFIGLLTPEGNIIEANDTALDFAGIKLEDIAGKPFWEAHWWSNSRENQEQLKNAIKEAAKGNLIRYEVTVQGKDSQIVIDFSLKPIVDEEGKIIWLIPEGRDITQTKLAAEALKESEEKYRAINESAQDAIIVSNSKGKITSWNTGAEKIFGYSKNEALNQPLNLIVPEKHIENHLKGLVDMAETGLAKSSGKILELEGRKKNGEIFPLELALSHWYQNKEIYFSAIIRDISERKINQLQIEFYNKISKIIGNADSLNKALYATIEEICTTLDWDYGEFWLPDPTNSILEFGPIYYRKDKKVNSFITASKKFTFKKGIGLCGVVWETKQPYWYSDVTKIDEATFPRKQAAIEAGLKTGLGVPVFDKNEIIAIIVLYDFEAHERREDLIKIISSVSAQLGSLFIKKKAEDALKQSEQQLENTLISAPVPIIISSIATGKVVFANKEALKLLAVPEDIVLSETPPDFYYSDKDRQKIREGFSKYGFVENQEINIERYDGKVLDILLSVKKMKFRNEDVAVVAFSDITSQKQTEKKFKDLIESAPDAIIIFNQDGHIVIANDQTEKFFGYAKGELEGKSGEILIPKRHRDRFYAFIQAKFKHPETIKPGETYESKALKKKNNEFPVEINLGTLDTEEGILISAVIRDITERRLSQEELQKKHNQLAEAQEVAHIGSWEWNIEANHLSWSDEMYNIYGIDPGSEINYEKFVQYVHPDDKDYVNMLVQKALSDFMPFNYYHRIVTPDGNIRILNSRGKVIVKNNKPIKLLGTGMDVTDLKLAEEKIKESEEKFRYFVETSSELIWSLDNKYRWNYLNPQACKEIYGYHPEEMLGKLYTDFIIEKNQDERSFLQKLFEQGAVFHHESIHRRKDGTPVNLKFNGILLKDEAGNIIGATGTATDITELKKAEEHLRQTESALRSLHDITTGQDTLDTDEKIEALLNLGCDRFQMDKAFLVQIIEDEAKVIATSTVNNKTPVENDLILDLNFHKKTLSRKEPLLVKDINKSEFKSSDLFADQNINSFISEKILISGNVFGTISFISEIRRSTDFNPTDSEIVKLMAQWLGGVIQREQVKQNLMNAIVETEEQERKRFAEDLHDSLGQILSAAKLNLSAMESKVKEMGNGMADFYENSKSLVDYAMQEAKAISQNLMPAALENYGLEKTIETLCEKISYTNKVKINFHSFNLENRFKQNIEIGLYRIAQELINNAVKHSNAEEINIQLIQHKKSILLMVEDDGEGFKDDASTIISGMGLKNVQTRVKSLHGTFSIDTSPGNGTIATVEIPLNE